MLNLTLITSAAKSAFVGAVATKVVDTLVSSKINHKVEHNKWLRQTKFELFSSLVDNIVHLDETNFEEKSKEIRRNISKVILLVKEKKLTNSMERYLNILQRFQSNEINYDDFKTTNNAFISYLKANFHN